MSRRHAAEKREVLPDAKYGDRVLTKFMNNLMYDGKKSAAERIVYNALDRVEAKVKRAPVEIFHEALDNIQRYLASTVPPTNLTDPGGNPVTEAIYVPLNTDIFDPYSMTNPTPTSRIMFYTPMDHLAGTPMPGARQLQLNPVNFAYEIGLVQGLNNEGQDLVLRKMQAPTNADPRPVTYDASVQPRFLARRLGIPDAGAPGGYRDGLVVQRWREGACG